MHCASAQASKGEGGSDEEGPGSDRLRRRKHLIDVIRRNRMRHWQANGFAQPLEQIAILSFVDCLEVRTDQFDAKRIQTAIVSQFTCDVQRRLTTHACKQTIRSFDLQDATYRRRKQWFDVHSIGHLRVILDRGRIRVDQNHLIAILTEGAHRL